MAGSKSTSGGAAAIGVGLGVARCLSAGGLQLTGSRGRGFRPRANLVLRGDIIPLRRATSSRFGGRHRQELAVGATRWSGWGRIGVRRASDERRAMLC